MVDRTKKIRLRRHPLLMKEHAGLDKKRKTFLNYTPLMGNSWDGEQENNRDTSSDII